MYNTIILIKLCDDIDDEKKLVENKLTSAMRYYNTEMTVEKEGVYYIKVNQDISIELYSVERAKWLVNICGHSDRDKCLLINTLANDRATFEDVTIIFDAISNNILKEFYPLINELENAIRSEFCYKIIDKCKVDIFEVVDKLNVNDEYRFEYVDIPSNVNTKLQRYGLIDLIKYMCDHSLGGDEFSRFYDEFKKCKRKGKYEEFEEIITTKIFSEISKKIKNAWRKWV